MLAGAVAKGAFAAGAIDVLTRRQMPITRIVATSAGALSGTLLAAGIRAGRAEEAAEALVQLWVRSAHWRNAIDLSAREILGGRGLSTSKKLRAVLRSAVEPLLPGARMPIDLRLIVTALAGDPKTRRDECTTRFESMVRAAGGDFDASEVRERLYTAATASAAFPGLYAPVRVSGLGECVDGGAVNNAPIGHALDGSIRRIVLISDTPSLIAPPRLRGLRLVEHLGAVLVHERLYRDLREARAMNRRLAALDQLVTKGTLTAAELAAVRDALGWQHKRRLELVEIRPAAELRGGPFSALRDRSLREEYVAEGRRAAVEALSIAVAAPVAKVGGP